MHNVLTVIAENWYLFVAALALGAVIALAVRAFIKLPTEDQLNCVREWLLYVVIEAEKQFGSGTGAVKLRWVYDKFVTAFPEVAKFVSFQTFSDMVDKALERMEELLKNNALISKFVGIEDKTEEK